MNLSQLQYFRTLAKEEHYTRAAQILSITQPSLSHAIAQLEQELGTRLFEKKGRSGSDTIWKNFPSICGGIFKSIRGGRAADERVKWKQRRYDTSRLHLYPWKHVCAEDGAEILRCLSGLSYRLSVYCWKDRRYHRGAQKRPV